MLNRLSLKAKLAAGFGLLLAILVALGVTAYRSIIRLDEAATEVDRKATQKELASSLSAFVMMESSSTRGYVLTGETRMLEGDDLGKREIREALERLAPLLRSEESKRQYAEIVRSNNAYRTLVDLEIGLRRGGKNKEAQGVMATQAIPALEALDHAISTFSDRLVKGKVQADQAQDADVGERKAVIFGMCLGGIVLGLVAATLLARSIAGATDRMVRMIHELAANNLAVGDLEVTSQDELGQAALALNQMKNNLGITIHAIARNAEHVASASEELNATSQQISANSDETSAQANVVTQSAQQVNQNLQSVSTGAEEMTSTIQSIASNAYEAATVASNAVQTAQSANATVGKLGESSAEIGEVIKVITSIAQQTNLLALNATIEAARAGEAGKGFAVVANEVKELAKQTAKATEDISRRITAIQTDTKGAVEAIGSISAVINHINDISGTIATAVEQQSATTNEMTRNVADAAKGSAEITHNIAGVAEAARGTSVSAQESRRAANELAEMAEQLRGLVAQFKIDSPAGAQARPQEAPLAMAARAGR